MSLQKRWSDIQEKISATGKKVTVIAVSKTQSIQTIQEAYQLGLRDFGENYVQEVMPKIEELPKDIQWHYIGNLQTNKMNKIVPHVQWLHSVSQLSQIQKLEKIRAESERFPNILIQLNLAGETTKMGLQGPHIQSNLEWISEQTQLQVCGLMTFPPYQDDPEKNRRYFAEMATWKETINAWKLPRIEIRELSMGVSNDYEIAIQEGATMVRLGELLFGARISL